MLLGSSAFLELDDVLGSLGAQLLSCKNSICNPCVKEKENRIVFLLSLGLRVNGYGFRLHGTRAH